jgi:hypothetical protein
LSSIGAKRQSITRREAPDIELAVSSSGILKFAAAILINNIEAQTEGGGSSSIETGHTVHQILHKTVLQNICLSRLQTDLRQQLTEKKTSTKLRTQASPNKSMQSQGLRPGGMDYYYNSNSNNND